MALHGCSCSLSLPSVSALPPAKTQISSDYSGLHILRSPCATLNPPLPVISSLSFVILSTKPSSTKRFATRATTQQNYVYPDPIPEFAEAETLKFKVELMRKLSMEKEKFGGELDEVVSVCTEEINPYWIEDNPTFGHKKWDTYPHKTKHYLPDSFNQTGQLFYLMHGPKAGNFQMCICVNSTLLDLYY